MGGFDFRTTLKLGKAPFELDHKTPMISIGSCFAEHIGNKLEASKFPILSHMLGTVFSPLAICKLLDMVRQDGRLAEPGFTVNQDGVWSHFDLHSSFSALRKEDVTARFESAKEQLRNHLQANGIMLVTFGTAFHYIHQKSGEPVTNCHKVPNKEFEKRLMSVDEIVEGFKMLRVGFPKMRFILTVSPVRHIKDTIELNSVSKSILRLACHELSKLDGFHYFPAYEIMMDDLRDYRFYNNDMLHPSPTAIDYIWEQFKETFMSRETIRIVNDWQKVLAGITHRPQFEDTDSYRRFLDGLRDKIKGFEKWFNVDRELNSSKKLK